MDAQQFLAEFGHIANAPGGIARLRELVLHLAVSGRLTNQIETESADDFFSDINLKRESLESSGDIRINRKIRNEPARGAWRIPDNWLWCRFGELSNFSAGRTPSRKESKYWNTGEYPWLSIADLDHGKIVSRSSETISEIARTEVFKSPPAPAGSLLMSFKLTIGKMCLLGIDSYHNEAIIRISPFADELINYFFKCLNGFDLSAGNKAAIKGNTLNQDSISNIEIALPPREEILRIVAKVDELMTLCDQLEAQQQKRRTLQNHLRQATLQAVAASQSPHELQESWQRLQANFGQLFSAPEDVVAFKGLILDLAVSGNLSDVEYRHHSTGAELLEAIAERRISWSHEAESQEKKEAQTMLKKLRTQQVNPPETNLPVHWAWATFLQVSQAVVDCHNKTAPYVANGIHLVRTTDIRNGEMNLTNTKKVTEETFDYWSRRMPPKAGDIFFTREAPMGEAAIVPEGEKVCLGQRTMLLRLFPELFNNRFLLYVIRSPSFQTRMVEAAIGMTVKHLRVGGVEDLVVPVPPKPEQDAIVSIIDALFEICDRFEKQLSKKQRISENLVTSSVAALTGIAIEQEEEPMKAPQTELVAPVRLGTPPDVKAQAPLATILARHNGEMSAKDLWQRFGGEIDAFYAQLKAEVAHGWLLEPAPAEMREKAES
ncbi:restriction endonuclease subunit S [Vibrio cholerae]|nr:restriction endonuclease subunit S [Vibrio cholerae]